MLEFATCLFTGLSAIAAVLAIIVGPRIARREKREDTVHAVFMKALNDVSELGTAITQVRYDFKTKGNVKKKYLLPVLDKQLQVNLSIVALKTNIGDNARPAAILMALLVKSFEDASDTSEKTVNEFIQFRELVVAELEKAYDAALKEVAEMPLLPSIGWLAEMTAEWRQLVGTPAK